MYTKSKSCSGSSLAARATARGEAFLKALHSKCYPKRTRPSTGEVIYDTDGRRRFAAGTLDNGVFKKTIRAEHVLKHPPAIAFQRTVVLQLKAKGCHTVKVILAQTGQVLYVPFERIITRGFDLNRGFGPQIALCLAQWDNADNPQGSLFGGEV